MTSIEWRKNICREWEMRKNWTPIEETLWVIWTCIGIYTGRNTIEEFFNGVQIETIWMGDPSPSIEFWGRNSSIIEHLEKVLDLKGIKFYPPDEDEGETYWKVQYVGMKRPLWSFHIPE